MLCKTKFVDKCTRCVVNVVWQGRKYVLRMLYFIISLVLLTFECIFCYLHEHFLACETWQRVSSSTGRSIVTGHWYPTLCSPPIQRSFCLSCRSGLNWFSIFSKRSFPLNTWHIINEPIQVRTQALFDVQRSSEVTSIMYIRKYVYCIRNELKIC